MRNVMSHPLEHPRLFLPETNSFPEKENVRLVKGRRWTIFLGYMKPKTLPGPLVADKMKSATMSNVNKDILFLEKEIFPIYRRKDRQKVLMFFGMFTNRQKRPDWITNQWKLYWSNTKPYPQTSWNL